MSSDYLDALEFDPQYIRLGTILVWTKEYEKYNIHILFTSVFIKIIKEIIF